MVSVRRHARYWRAYLAGGGLVVGLLAIVLQRKHPRASADGQQPPERDHGPAKPKPPSYARRHYDHPSEEEHRTQEQFIWRYSVALNVGIAVAAVLTLIAAGGTYFQAKRQAAASYGQLATMQLTTRPYLFFVLDSLELKHLTFPEGDVPKYIVRFHFFNAGAGPAVVSFEGSDMVVGRTIPNTVGLFTQKDYDVRPIIKSNDFSEIFSEEEEFHDKHQWFLLESGSILNVYLKGGIVYTDAFNTVHETDFCYKIRAPFESVMQAEGPGCTNRRT